MGRLPTHQEAAWPKNNDGRKTPIAAGLKICFLFIARKYFEAMAKTAARKRKIRSVKVRAGVIIRARIKAEIRKDSVFGVALKILAKRELASQQITARKPAEKRMLKPLNDKKPRKLKTTAVRTKKIR